MLLEHLRLHLPPKGRLVTAIRLEWLVDEVLGLIDQEGQSFDYAKKRLVRKMKTGAYWKESTRQRRWKQIYSPVRPKGRRSRQWARFLISMLGAEFYRCTGNVPTRGSAEGFPSKFQGFASLFLSAFEIRDQEGLVREYIKERRKSNPFGFRQV